ncbi:MAG: DNA polymerase III subunit beta [Aeromicrobium sp.]|uniref:DNA polymerase III subunit beta n=1 Tax=Aeromicrobium sp. TaxID=1871063 RepID=UPI0025C58CE2|nr:DNA polymerase III subunit beta [Aeromicrobium sp.]MCK5891684.1 DNA polymerase III subunit beta [Aeromicrobium sp.]MDF1705804.1 DNA polymerase III subunit beta [Aeromicrobium sp.]
MKFRIERDTLADAVAWTARSLPVRPSVPVLAGLLIEAGTDGLTLSGFDYETSTRATLPAEVSADGRALVSGRLLSEIVKSLPGKPVDVELEGTKVRVECGSARFSLQTMPVEEYPRLPQMPTATGTVKADTFVTAVQQAGAAAGRDEMLPLLTGVRLELEGSTISLMATDRFRASLRDLEWFPEASDLSARALVPARVLGETARSFSGGSDITIAVSSGESGDGLIGFEGTVGNGSRRTTTRLLEGDFPRVRQLFAATPETVAYVSTQALVDAVKRVALVAERNTPVRLSFSEGTLLLEAGTGDEAQASESIEATVNGGDISIGFNPSYLLEGLGVMSDPVVHLAFTQHTKPAAISGVGEIGAEPDGAFRYLIMPVRLQT